MASLRQDRLVRLVGERCTTFWISQRSRVLTRNGICSDLYAVDIRRGRALLAYNMATTGGSVLGPIISGWVSMSTIGWRLSFWIGMAMGGILFIGVLLGMPETNHNVIMDRRAKEMRNNDNIS